MKNKKSFKKKLNKVGPFIEPCGSPVILFYRLLLLLCIRTPVFYYLNMSKCNTLNSHQNQETEAFQLKDHGEFNQKALYNSMKTHLSKKLSGRPYHHSSNKQIKTCRYYDFVEKQI